jgi:hypothetical protein
MLAGKETSHILRISSSLPLSSEQSKQQTTTLSSIYAQRILAAHLTRILSFYSLYPLFSFCTALLTMVRTNHPNHGSRLESWFWFDGHGSGPMVLPCWHALLMAGNARN